MPHIRVLLVVLSILIGVSVAPAATAGLVANQDVWYSLYFQSVHSGYTHIEDFADQWDGKKAIREDSVTVTKLTIFGTVVEQDITSHCWTNPKSGEPYYQTFNIESGGSTTSVAAAFSAASISAVLKSGTETTSKTIPIPAGEKIVDSETEGMDSSAPLKVGQTETDVDFDPVSLSLDKEISTVQAVNIPVKDARDGQIHSAARIFISDPDGSATAFQERSGTPILVLTTAGISMVCTDEDHAMTTSDSSQSSFAIDPTPGNASSQQAYNPSPDLAVATSVDPTGLKLTNERSLVELTVRLTVHGEKPRILTENSVPVPLTDASPISELADGNSVYLSSAPYLTVDDPKIKQTAQKIVGSTLDSYAAVKLIHDWVYAHMSPVGSLGLPRSATDVLANPNGVCRDYAVLYTALARAAGIPTKVNAGLVGFNGRFYYHAWASSFVGGSVGWLQVDPTIPTMFVDASHIALGTGDATVMFTLADVIGNTQVETLTMRNSL